MMRQIIISMIHDTWLLLVNNLKQLICLNHSLRDTDKLPIFCQSEAAA